MAKNIKTGFKYRYLLFLCLIGLFVFTRCPGSDDGFYGSDTTITRTIAAHPVSGRIGLTLEGETLAIRLDYRNYYAQLADQVKKRKSDAAIRRLMAELRRAASVDTEIYLNRFPDWNKSVLATNAIADLLEDGKFSAHDKQNRSEIAEIKMKYYLKKSGWKSVRGRRFYYVSGADTIIFLESVDR